MGKHMDVVLSVSAAGLWEKCPWAYRLKYELGWRPDKDKKTYRMGTAWHRCFEIVSSEPGGKCWRCIQKGAIDPDCYLCGGTGVMPDDLMEAVCAYLDYYYDDMPENFDKAKWDLEKFTILYAFCGHRWRYPDVEFETIATEVAFSLPIINPDNSRKMPSCRLDGVIDALWRHKSTGLVYIGERKSTGSPLDEFFERLDLDSQITTYALAARTLQLSGALEQFGIKPDDPPIKGCFYDAWHKPSIAPKLLTQPETSAFLEDGIYFETEFDVEHLKSNDGLDIVKVNDELAELKPGKERFAIRETPEMFGNRLLADVVHRPEHYFRQQEITVSDPELVGFQRDCCRLVDLIRHTKKKCLWRRHKGGCRIPFKCDYYNACHNFKDHPLDPQLPPEGYVATHEHPDKQEED